MTIDTKDPFMFVSCKRVGTDLHCTPWSYAQTSDPGAKRAVGPIAVLRDALTVTKDAKGVEWVGIAKGTLARVCALIGEAPAGYALRWNERATVLDLVVSGFLFRAS